MTTKPLPLSLESPDQPDVRALIEALDAYQVPLYPAESHHGIDLAALGRPEVLFAVARDASGRAVACGAVVLGPLEGALAGELKRMWVEPAQRGRGLAGQLLRFLEAEAAGRGVRLFVLETGIHQHAAIGLYERAGYVRCEPFGDYRPDPYSVFMRRPVA